VNTNVGKSDALFTNYGSAVSADYWSRMHSHWSHLASKTRQQDPFCSLPQWQLSFHDAFSPKRRLLFRETSDSLIAFAEKVSSPENIYLTPIEPHWLFGNPLLGPQAVDLLSDTLFEIDKTYYPLFPRILISGIAPKGAMYRQLMKRFDSKFTFNRHSSDIQCGASLAGGIDGFLSRRSSNHRKKLKKETSGARRNGLSFERRVAGSFEEADEVFSRMIAVEMASWKGIAHCGMAEKPTDKFYRLMLRRMSPSKTSRIIFARHEDKDIGFIYGGMAGSVYRGQQFSYDDEWRNASIGNLLQFEQLKWLCEEGATRYDMGPLLGPRMEYKRHWTEKQFRIEAWTLHQH
jgi:hypothetical protein